jgi:aminopeptidase N
MPATIFARSLFPLFGIDPSFIKRAEALAAEVVPVVRTNLLDRADRMTRMLRSRG